jgi:nitrate reductase gamma subunit
MGRVESAVAHGRFLSSVFGARIQPTRCCSRVGADFGEDAVQTVYYIILVPMVYVAFAVFFIGTAVRLVKIFRTPKHPTTLQIYPERRPKWLWATLDTFLFPTVRRHKPVLWVFVILFHIGLLLLIIGHLELFADFAIFQIVPHEIFLGGGFVGLIVAITLLAFLFRRFVSPVRELSVPEDYYLLVLLFLIVLFGSQMDWARRWYEYGELTPEDYRTYLVSLLQFKPDLPFNLTSSGHSFMMLLHVFFANLFLMFFPFSQSMHSFLSLPMNKLRRG